MHKTARNPNPGRPLILLAVLAVSLLGLGPRPQVEVDGWTPITAGIDYREFVLPGPIRLFVARMDRDNPSLTFESSIAQGDGEHPRETVSAMATRYEGAVNSWNGAWGTRNDVVVAINGSFFTPETGETHSSIVHSGWVSRWTAGTFGNLGFVWTMDRQAAAPLCLYFPPHEQVLQFLSNGRMMPVAGADIPPVGNGIVLYTASFSGHSPAPAGGVEIVLEMSRPAMLVPHPRQVVGVIREIRQGLGPLLIPFDHLVVTGAGRAASDLLESARLGETVGISLEMIDMGSDCNSPGGIDLAKVYAGIGGGFVFLRDGVIHYADDYSAQVRHPRTAIAYNGDFVFFLVADGRQEGWSVGASLPELAEFTRDRLGASWAVNLDGGGSSTMWINGRIVNRPSDGGERRVIDGFMMVITEPMAVSGLFGPYTPVATAYDTAVLVGPGSEYPILSVVPASTFGWVLPHLAGLEGVLATGAYWWKVNLAGVVGWVAESSLATWPEYLPAGRFSPAPFFFP